YKLVWDDFCAWYLELIKPGYQQPIGEEALEKTKAYFQNILKLIHPFMPFISEELWHDELFGKRDEKDCCVVADFPSLQPFESEIIKDFEHYKHIISEMRNLRNNLQISPKTTLALNVKPAGDGNWLALFGDALE